MLTFLGTPAENCCAPPLLREMFSCKLNGINEEEWLEDLLERTNGIKQSALVNLLPHRWEKDT